MISARVAALYPTQANDSCKAPLELIVKLKKFRHALRDGIPQYYFLVVCRTSVSEWLLEWTLENSGDGGGSAAQRTEDE